MVGTVTSPASSLDVLNEVGVASEQSHLTQVVVGVPPEERDEGELEEEDGEGDSRFVNLSIEEDPDEILKQVTYITIPFLKPEDFAYIFFFKA